MIDYLVVIMFKFLLGNSYLCIKGVMKAFVARGVTLGLETSVESHNTLGSQTLIMPVVRTSYLCTKGVTTMITPGER
jgi:hypothetical protein